MINSHTNHSIPYLPATAIVSGIRNKEFSVETVLRLFLDRIEKYNTKVNAIVCSFNKEDLIKEAKEKDKILNEGIGIGALFGLPITVKDSFNVKGLTTSNGQSPYKDLVVQEDAELISRLKEAGAIIIGKTNLPLFSIDWQTTNLWYGRTNNPYDLERVPGGSSGASAAAIAMGFSALELGSDAGGSIRVPAHFCGVCGLRTTEHALSNRGQFKFPNKPQGHRNLTVPGPIAKNVSDLLLMMPVLWENERVLTDTTPIKFNSSTWDGKPLKIAYASIINELEIDHEYQSIFDSFINKLKTTEHTLENAQPKYDEAIAHQLHGNFLGFEIAAASPIWQWLTAIFFYFFILIKYRDKLWARGVAQGISFSASQYLKALEQKDALKELYSTFFKKYDIWISPVAAMSAFKHQKTGKPFIINSKKIPYTKAIASYNFSSALSGHPIVVIPIGKTSNNLPVGIQIHAKKWDDKKLLEIAKYFESFTEKFMAPNCIINEV
jgi:amidase